MKRDPGSITRFITALKSDGDTTAAQAIWDRYAARLVRLTRSKLGDMARGVADEEDVALSAFESFFRRAAADGFQKLDDRVDLWQLLVLIAGRKLVDLSRYEQRLKRGGQFSATEIPDELVAMAPTPEQTASTLEEYERLLKMLKDEELAQIAVARMEGYTNFEIADSLGCTRQTVQRRLNLIRSIWKQELQE